MHGHWVFLRGNGGHGVAGLRISAPFVLFCFAVLADGRRGVVPVLPEACARPAAGHGARRGARQTVRGGHLCDQLVATLHHQRRAALS